MNIIDVSNSLDPDQAGHYVRPGLGQICLQMLTADDTCRQSVNKSKIRKNQTGITKSILCFMNYLVAL